MKASINVKQGGPGGRAILEGINLLTGSHLLVGIPEKNSARKKDVITNAQLAFIHTHGVRDITMRTRMDAMMINRNITYSQALALYIRSKGSPLWHSPPRPIIEPAIEDRSNKAMIDAELQLAAKAALDGKKGVAKTHLKRAGMIAQNCVRGWFTNPKNRWPPNAPSTIKRKGSSNPLINTGDLRKSITYVLVEGT